MCPDVILLISAVHVYTMRNHCLLTSSLTLTSSRLFPILLDPKSFQTILASVTWLPGHVLSIYCRLIIILTIFVWLTLTLAKVCPHSHLITGASRIGIDSNRLGSLPDSWSIWKNGDTVHPSLFQDVVGSVFHLPCSTIQIHGGSQICEVHCIWCISTLGFCMRRLCDPTSSSSCTRAHPDSC